MVIPSRLSSCWNSGQQPLTSNRSFRERGCCPVVAVAVWLADVGTAPLELSLGFHGQGGSIFGLIDACVPRMVDRLQPAAPPVHPRIVASATRESTTPPGAPPGVRLESGAGRTCVTPPRLVQDSG
jgi:hypothetical protein